MNLIIKRIFNLPAWMFVLITSGSCIDIIDLKTSKVEEVLVIEGKIYADRPFPEVLIHKSAAFVAGAAGTELPVSGASVRILESNGAVFQLEEINPRDLLLSTSPELSR